MELADPGQFEQTQSQLGYSLDPGEERRPEGARLCVVHNRELLHTGHVERYAVTGVDHRPAWLCKHELEASASER